MESILIIVIGLIFSVLSKSVKDKKEIEKERQKRKEQIDKGLQSSHKQTSIPKSESKQKPFREIFMEELKKAGDGEGELGDIFRRTLGEETEKEIETSETKSQTMDNNYEYADSRPTSIDDSHMSSEEYTDALDAKIEAYMNSPTFDDEVTTDNNITKEEISVEKSQDKDGQLTSRRKKKIVDNRQYNPFTKSLNKRDIIRGIIFSEVFDKPKALRK